MLLSLKERIDKIDKALLVDMDDKHLVFKSTDGVRTIFLKMDKIIEKPSFKIGNNYKLEHINGRAKVTLL